MTEQWRVGSDVPPRESLWWLVRTGGKHAATHRAVIEGQQMLTACGRWLARYGVQVLASDGTKAGVTCRRCQG